MEKSLLDMKKNSCGKVSRLEGGVEFQHKVSSLNIRIGKIVKKVVAEPLRGPIIIKIDNTEIAIGRGLASRIFVEEE